MRKLSDIGNYKNVVESYFRDIRAYFMEGQKDMKYPKIHYKDENILLLHNPK
jgi:hypothetical protein